MANHDDAASSSSSSSFIYDVFLSFRGYTCYGFTDCLYHALTKKGIKTFRDNEDLRIGDEIRPTLVDAIEKSRMSIVVLCQNYASSTWCLDEIVKIMDCSDNGRKRRVLPIFYKVEPSDVRYQKNQYETAMNKHEGRYGKDSNRIKGWKSALYAVGDLSGQHCTKDMYEGEIIDKIVEEVLKKLPLEPLHIKHPIGLDLRFNDVKSLLDIESHDILCMLGIYGDGETGKTAFAVELYNKIKHQFEASSFLANVNEKSKESINGLEDLQKTLLSEMGEEAKSNIGSTFKGSSEIKRRLRHKRVLLVLDDVGSIQQLETLAGGGDWFGPGSRIIVTTRDEDVLDKYLLNGVKIKKYCTNEGEFESMEVDESDPRQKRSVEVDDVVGFVNDVKVVIEELKEEDSHNNVVSIIGMGGLGKTTLARKIYNNCEVKKLFPCHAWSCVSKDYNIKEVLLNLLGCLKPLTVELKDLKEEDLKNNLRKCLNKKKYLIVLDDIWDHEVWDDVKEAFPNDNNNGKILITSRNDMVANYTSTRPPHYLSFLDEEESWKLFCKKVFLGKECPSNLEPIGRSIVESGGGLPLAVVTLAGLVAKKRRSEREWLRIKGHVHWHLAQEKTEKVMDVLKLSYDFLPQRLKPCFLYFGIFPEDTEISARELIRLWIAERFVESQESRMSSAPEPEDVGEEYLEELVDRSLVQVVCRRSDGGVKRCQIHDLLRDICISESRANGFLEVCTESNFHTLSKSTNRLSMLRDVKYYIPSIKCDKSSEVCKESKLHTLSKSIISKVKSYMSSTECNESRTHSLFFFDGEKDRGDILRNSRSVSVLHLEKVYYIVHVTTFSEFKALIHLRYLKLGRTRSGLLGIPDCIWSLQNLETIESRDWVDISDGIWKLKRLRHIYMLVYPGLPANKRGANSKTMWNLQTLNHLLVHEKNKGYLLDTIGSFPNLTKLGLSFVGRDGDKDEELRSLHCLNNLCTLHIRCCKALDLCPTISLDGVTFPSSLTKITIEGLKGLDSKHMSALGQITNLKILKLISPKGSANSLCCGADGDFPQLIVFHMGYVYDVCEVILEEGAMPRLERAVIHHCYYLKKVSPRLESLGNLQWVHGKVSERGESLGYYSWGHRPDYYECSSLEHWETASTK